jgi:cytochrome P450
MTLAAPPGTAELGSPAFFVDPYPVYARLRATAPVFWHEPWQGWVVTRYGDVLTVLQNARHFSNAGRQTLMLRRLPPEIRVALAPLEEHYTQGGLSNQDPPQHTRLRSLIVRAFTPRTVEAMRPHIQALVDELLVAAAQDESFDLIRAFAYPLPALVIAHLLGLPPEDCKQLKQWSDEITAFLGQAAATPEIAAQGQVSLLELRAYFARQIERRRRAPGPDLISALLAAEENGQGLTKNELLGTCVTLLLGGHETTTNLIGNGVHALLRNRPQWAQLGQDVSWAGAMDELLRYDAPVQRAWRVVAEDVVLGDHRLRAGELVFAMLGAANRDPVQFHDPDRLDMSRAAARHLGLSYGIHYCLGGALARLEAATALQALRERWPGLSLVPDRAPEWKPNMAFRGLRSLLVRLA